MKTASVSRVAACAAAAGVLGLPLVSHAFMSRLNALGQGIVQEQLWVFPNHPPATPTFTVTQQNPPIATLGPVPGGDPRTHVVFVGTSDHDWRVHSDFEAASGDSVDWHSMLPFVTASSTDAEGSIEVSSIITGPNTATFTVMWSGSDPGVAMHIGWFEGTTELLDSPIKIGPFSSTDVFSIVSSGPIEMVDMEVSGAAVSLVPSPGVAVVLGLGGLMAGRRRRS